MTSLPITVLGADSVWMESDALDQLASVASRDGCCQAVGMPDLHPGRGIPIGAAFRFTERVWPELVGSDAGCGVLTLVARRAGARGDLLERRVTRAWSTPVLADVPSGPLLEAVWNRGPRGLAGVAGVPEALAEWVTHPAFEDDAGPSGPGFSEPRFAEQLGSIGGGNHFAEVSHVASTTDRAAAKRAGLRRDAQVLLVHSGSRGLGAALHRRYASAGALGLADAPAYLADLRGAVRYARANRVLIAWRLMQAAGLGAPHRIAAAFDIVHNTVEREGDTFLHRKGAAPAHAGQFTVVLGSRGAPSWVLEGRGNEACLSSVAHGAGRRMARGEAFEKLRAKRTKRALSRTALGSRVLCDDTRLLYEEHPDAYKAIEPVVKALEEAGAGRRVACLSPLLTVKK
ncbi:MAG: RtcB family protein [Sandaracinaceae bacterium]